MLKIKFSRARNCHSGWWQVGTTDGTGEQLLSPAEQRTFAFKAPKLWKQVVIGTVFRKILRSAVHGADGSAWTTATKEKGAGPALRPWEA